MNVAYFRFGSAAALIAMLSACAGGGASSSRVVPPLDNSVPATQSTMTQQSAAPTTILSTAQLPAGAPTYSGSYGTAPNAASTLLTKRDRDKERDLLRDRDDVTVREHGGRSIFFLEEDNDSGFDEGGPAGFFQVYCSEGYAKVIPGTKAFLDDNRWKFPFYVIGIKDGDCKFFANDFDANNIVKIDIEIKHADERR